MLQLFLSIRRNVIQNERVHPLYLTFNWSEFS